MAIFLDSASVDDAAAAAGLGFVAGITTNPKLLAGVDALPRIDEILRAIPEVPVFCQLTRLDSEDEMIEDAERALTISPNRIVIKVPTRTRTLATASRLIGNGIPCAMTTIFSPAQALIAAEIGALWVIPYVDRTTRMGGDGMELVSEMRASIDSVGAGTRVMAGSIKFPAEAAMAQNQGAHDITASLEIIEGMGDHRWSEQAIRDFEEAE